MAPTWDSQIVPPKYTEYKLHCNHNRHLNKQRAFVVNKLTGYKVPVDCEHLWPAICKDIWRAFVERKSLALLNSASNSFCNTIQLWPCKPMSPMNWSTRFSLLKCVSLSASLPLSASFRTLCMLVSVFMWAGHNGCYCLKYPSCKTIYWKSILNFAFVLSFIRFVQFT